METVTSSVPNPEISAEKFFDTWCTITSNYWDTLLKEHIWLFNNGGGQKEKTKLIEETIYGEICKNLDFNISSVYHSDALFFSTKKDLVPGSGVLMNIQIALEHENKFWLNLIDELSHLLLLNCKLRVLVSYPQNESTKKNEILTLFHAIISSHEEKGRFSTEKSILLIFGTRDRDTLDIYWEGYIYDEKDWVSLLPFHLGQLIE
jgi:hypothetical protein